MARNARLLLTKSTEMISFSFQERTYQIDPAKRKVYQRFVEIETGRASEIISTWRAEQIQI